MFANKHKRPGRRLDMAEFREALRDDRTWCGLGLVVKRSEHFFIEDNDVLVEVDLMPHGQPLLCRLGAVAGGPGQGVWAIPPVGSEVAVLIPEGELDADCMIIATLSSGTLPDGLNENVTVIVAKQGGNVLVHDGSANDARPMATKADIDTLTTWIAAHVHSGGVLPGDLTGVPNAAPPPAIGTMTLKAK